MLFFSVSHSRLLSVFILPLFALLLLTSCSKPEHRFVASNNDQCNEVQPINSSQLSHYTQPFKQQMLNKTGVKVLEEGTEAMLNRAWLTQQAERTIDIQYFIFSADNVGLIATDYLVRAAKRGVKVRMLVDDIMVDAKGDELLALDSHPNLSIRIYNPMLNIGKNLPQKLFNLATRFTDVNQRMHNKAFIVDQHVAITGGRNVADEYFGYDHQYNFRDRDVLLVGGVVKQVQSSFDLFWQDELSVAVTQLVKAENSLEANDDNKLTPVDFSLLHQYVCDPKNFDPQVRRLIDQVPAIFKPRSGSNSTDINHVVNLDREKRLPSQDTLRWVEHVEYVSDIPGKSKASRFLGNGGLSTEKLIALLKQAKRSVFIQTPYLVTSDLGKSLLSELVNKGVEVNILTNSLASTDNLEAFSGYQRDRAALLKTGVQIFEFKPNAKIRQKVMAQSLLSTAEANDDSTPIFGLHAKSMVIDDNITVIGTFNLDPRSANLNTESIAVIKDPTITQQVKQGMLVEIEPENAWHTTLDWNPDREVSQLKQLRVKLRRIVPKGIL
ncbi:phospholipase D family protein [Algibacillus agarilyticus]|uniref:phospholipase D family protein n=1 Tax=Algibacillus agarilyticus TaxID=2234133 RepID=UPI000DCFAA84|nr:phospholipase D family protein [Algibacillus agarilyticus]